MSDASLSDGRPIASSSVCAQIDGMYFENGMRQMVPNAIAAGPRRCRQIEIIHKFVAFIDKNWQHSPSLHDMCSAIHSPQRTLRAICVEHLGMSPLRYLHFTRMQLTRRALLLKSARVTDIAMRYGFLELGRFSVSYRRMFGEMPSDSLRLTAAKQKSRR